MTKMENLKNTLKFVLKNCFVIKTSVQVLGYINHPSVLLMHLCVCGLIHEMDKGLPQ